MRQRPAIDLEIHKRLFSRALDASQVLERGLLFLKECQRLVAVLRIVAGERNDDQPSRTQLATQIDSVWKLFAANRAPCRPEIDKHDLSRMVHEQRVESRL